MRFGLNSFKKMRPFILYNNPYFEFYLKVSCLQYKMKHKVLQQVVFCKYEDGDDPTRTFRDLNGCLGLSTIKKWCKMIRDTGSTQLSTPSGDLRFARSSETIQEVKHKLSQKMMSARSLAKEYNISRSSAHCILTEDLKFHAYKVTIEPRRNNEQKDKRKNSLIGLLKTLEKRTPGAYNFRMKNCSISTPCTIPKINVLEPQAVSRQMEEVAL